MKPQTKSSLKMGIRHSEQRQKNCKIPLLSLDAGRAVQDNAARRSRRPATLVHFGTV